MTSTLMDEYQRSAQAELAQAHCLPLAVYHDAAVYEAEIAAVFHNDWVFACTEDQLANAGDYLALTIAGEPLVIIRGADGELRALSNICRHRGTLLLEAGYGQVQKNIVCPYHAWTFTDTGALKGAPMTGDIQVDKQQHCLPHFALACWQGLIFVNLSDAPEPFATKIAGLEKHLVDFDLSRFKHAYQTDTEHWHSNWKLAVENGIESYHLFKVHKETLETITPTRKAYYIEGNTQWSLTGGEMMDTRGKLEKFLTGSYPDIYNHYRLIFLPPSFIGVLTYDGFNWIHILPEGPEHCSVTPGGLLEYKIKDYESTEFQFTHQFLAEDKLICERAQQGMRARKGKGGKLVSMEQILVDFHQYLAGRLAKTPAEAEEHR